ncbi:MAG: DUF3078 domain-containing protein [Flavobacteriales bacterium]
MKKYFILAMILARLTSYGQIDLKEDTSFIVWRKGAFMAFNFNQVALINWAAGGENALSATAIFSGFIKKRNVKSYFETTLDMGYGWITNETNGFRKNEDKLDLNMKYGHRATKGNKIYYALLMNFRTQFAPGFNFPDDSTVISRFLAPGYLSVAAGIDYKPNDFFSVFVSPATGRLLLVRDQRLADQGQFGTFAAEFDANGNKIKDGALYRLEFGSMLRARFQKEVIKNVSLLTTLQLFNNYTDVRKDNRRNIDVNWETMINIKANKWLTTSIFTHLIYDDDIQLPTFETINGVRTEVGRGPKTQFKEVFGIGLSYKF